MKGVILAAGISSRLRPLTDSIPKCLLPIGRKTILERTIENLLECEIGDILIVTGYLENQLKNIVSQKYPQLKVSYISNPDYASTNNIYSLWLTKPQVISDDIILLDSDIIFDERIIQELLQSGYENCLAVDTKTALGDEEIKVTVDAQNRILSISKEVPLSRALGESIGIEKFSPHFLEQLYAVMDRKILQEKRVDEFYEAAFQEVIDRGYPLFAVDVGKYSTIEIDTIEDIRKAENEVIPYISSRSKERANKK